jgi:glycerol-3-phosphate cytidylyltransferase
MINNFDDEIVVYTSMVADLFHIGHLNLIKRAKKLGTKLIVGVIVDECVFQYKGRKPIFSTDERKSIISSIKYVDKVILQYERDGAYSASKLNNIDIIVRGDDTVLNKEKEYIENKGGKYIILPRTPDISTTNIIKKIKN